MRQLKNRAQFVRAARGQKLRGRLFSLQTVTTEQNNTDQSKGGSGAGIGLTVTKREGNSPERNRIKRRLRAAVAKCHSAFVDCNDYVLIGRRSILSASFEELVQAIKTSTNKLTPKLSAEPKAR